MVLNIATTDNKFLWTEHSLRKMRRYQLSAQRVMRVFRNPDRKEEGIAPKTIAAMQTTGTKKKPTEIWMMYQMAKSKIKDQKSKLRKVIVISAWRYPGISPKGEMPLIPNDILDELDETLNNLKI